jgi:hypothetical protein
MYFCVLNVHTLSCIGTQGGSCAQGARLWRLVPVLTHASPQRAPGPSTIAAGAHQPACCSVQLCMAWQALWVLLLALLQLFPLPVSDWLQSLASAVVNAWASSRQGWGVWRPLRPTLASAAAVLGTGASTTLPFSTSAKSPTSALVKFCESH